MISLPPPKVRKAQYLKRFVTLRSPRSYTSRVQYSQRICRPPRHVALLLCARHPANILAAVNLDALFLDILDIDEAPRELQDKLAGSEFIKNMRKSLSEDGIIVVQMGELFGVNGANDMTNLSKQNDNQKVSPQKSSRLTLITP